MLKSLLRRLNNLGPARRIIADLRMVLAMAESTGCTSRTDLCISGRGSYTRTGLCTLRMGLGSRIVISLRSELHLAGLSTIRENSKAHMRRWIFIGELPIGMAEVRVQMLMVARMIVESCIASIVDGCVRTILMRIEMSLLSQVDHKNGHAFYTIDHAHRPRIHCKLVCTPIEGYQTTDIYFAGPRARLYSHGYGFGLSISTSS